MSDTTHEKLKEMAQLSLFSGRISEMHVKNLQMFPFIMFNGVKAVNIDYDFSKSPQPQANDPPSKVIYNFQIEESADNSNLERRFEVLEQSIRTLFWKETLLLVRFNDILVYRSKEDVGV